MQHTLKPYLINAFYSCCMDTGYSPLICVKKWSTNVLPEHLKNESLIVFNIHPQAVRNLVFGKDIIEFEAMFSGISIQIALNYKSISRIYNAEEQFGLDFEVEDEKEDLLKNELNSKKKPHLTLVQTQKDN